MKPLRQLQQTGLMFDEYPIKKREKPIRFWENDSYLPNFDIATTEVFKMATYADVANYDGKFLAVYDIECYPNYFLVCFFIVELNSYIELRLEDIQSKTETLKIVRQLIKNSILVDFYGNNYDIPLLIRSLLGDASHYDLYQMSYDIIERKIPIYQLEKSLVKEFPKYQSIKNFINHIDVRELPTQPKGLKAYGAMLGVEFLQDLPFDPHKELNSDQKIVIDWYCKNDLKQLLLLFDALNDRITIRNEMSIAYKIDLRSRSDAQIAEDIFKNEYRKLGWDYKKLRRDADSVEPFFYKFPDFITKDTFKTDVMLEVYKRVRHARFSLNGFWKIQIPDSLDGYDIELGEGIYRIGIGGLHSSERCRTIICEDGWQLEEVDVESYYPRIIINQQLFPKHLDANFLVMYTDQVNKRIIAKQSGDKITNETGKIIINGAFGKFGSPYSIIFAPELLIQTTITGQLCLLLLIEMFELENIKVVSGNTDAVILHYEDSRTDDVKQILKDWQELTGFKLDKTEYVGLYSQDVNSYLAITKAGKIKEKGRLLTKMDLIHQPNGWICNKAIVEYLKNGIPLHETIYNSTDFADFLFVQNSKEGAVKGNEYIGHMVRWYYPIGERHYIMGANSGNKVANTDNARPLLRLPKTIPSDIDREYYVEIAKKRMSEFGFIYPTN